MAADRAILMVLPAPKDRDRQSTREASTSLLPGLGLPEGDRSGLLENLLVTDWPDELLERYRTTRTFYQGRFVARLGKIYTTHLFRTLLSAQARG